MGAWGYSAFDSDSGLDLCADLVHRCGAPVNDDDDIIGPGDAELLRASLLEVWASKDPFMQEASYAAAGLVAVALNPVPAQPHTSLFGGDKVPDGDPAALGYALGYALLVPRELALELAPMAVAAVAALRADTGWLSEWNEPAGMTTQLDALTGVLTAALPA